MGVEGGHMIEDDLNKLDSFYKRGVRYMTLTWNNSTSWASSAKDEANHTVPNATSGLNEFGKKVVHRMNELGMLIDLSHVGEKTFWGRHPKYFKTRIGISQLRIYALPGFSKPERRPDHGSGKKRWRDPG